MPKQISEPTVSSVRSRSITFFDRVRVLYNLSFGKEEKRSRVRDVERFAKELFDADKIGKNIKFAIDEAISNFTYLLPGSEVDDLVLDHFDGLISALIYDINAEIGALIH